MEAHRFGNGRYTMTEAMVLRNIPGGRGPVAALCSSWALKLYRWAIGSVLDHVEKKTLNFTWVAAKLSRLIPARPNARRPPTVQLTDVTAYVLDGSGGGHLFPNVFTVYHSLELQMVGLIMKKKITQADC